jgi:hypothetical protein
MSKHIALIENMVHQLEAKTDGSATRGHWYLEEQTDRVTREITWTLYHWGTIVAQLKGTERGIWGYDYVITKLYGESRSDADGVATFLNLFDIQGVEDEAEPYIIAESLVNFSGHFFPSTGTFVID